MEKKENVCTENFDAGERMKEEEGVLEDISRKESPATQAPTAHAKFKSVDALARAYGALEAEFTRRSQRIKELEKTVENLKANLSQTDGSGAEKLRKNADARREAAKKFDKFVEELGKAEEADKPNGLEEAERLEKEEGFGVAAEEAAAAKVAEMDTETAGTKEATSRKQTLVGEAFAAAENAELSSEALYEKACRDESVRLKIIGEYLNSVGKSSPPLTAGGVGTLATPPVRAKTIADAGNLALQYFKKPFDAR